MDFLGIGPVELLVVLFVAFLVLGPARMIEVARSLGRFMQEVRRTTSDLPNLLTMDDEPSATPRAAERQQRALSPRDGEEKEERSGEG
ncbi:MAG: twin-arginine translocase TatA/TatE family subunit [Chloroflexi bacterium]|nr:twin-arginine translocase TatA/TatE family subunit [Chloroflexota bacterium]